MLEVLLSPSNPPYSLADHVSVLHKSTQRWERNEIPVLVGNTSLIELTGEFDPTKHATDIDHYARIELFYNIERYISRA